MVVAAETRVNRVYGDRWVTLPNHGHLFLYPCFRLGLVPALAFYKTYIAAMSGAATSAGASKFQQFMNHPAG